MNERRPARDIPTNELEELLRRGIADPGRQAEISAELERRFRDQYIAGGASSGVPNRPDGADRVPYPTPPPPAGRGDGAPPHRRGPVPPPQAWRAGAPPPAAPAPSRSSRGTAIGCATAVVIVVVVAFLYAVARGLGDDSEPPVLAQYCVTPAGNCPLVDSLRPGDPCYCTSSSGNVGGYAQ